MGCDYRRIFLKRDLDLGKVQVDSTSMRFISEVDFDYCCLLFIKDRFSFLLPEYGQDLNSSAFDINRNNLSKKVKFVSDEEYLLTFEKTFKNKSKEFDDIFEMLGNIDDEDFGLDDEFFTMPKSVEELIKQLFPLQYSYVYYNCIEKDDLKSSKCRKNINNIVDQIVQICKSILKKYGFDKNEFCHINLRSGCSDAMLTKKADKNTFFGFKITC